MATDTGNTAHTVTLRFGDIGTVSDRPAEATAEQRHNHPHLTYDPDTGCINGSDGKPVAFLSIANRTIDDPNGTMVGNMLAASFDLFDAVKAVADWAPAELSADAIAKAEGRT